MKNLSYEDWEEVYKPIKENQGLKDFHPSVVNDEEKNVLTKAINDNKVWTLVDTDDGLHIISGFHFVNRMDVYITETPIEEEEIIEVKY